MRPRPTLNDSPRRCGNLPSDAGRGPVRLNHNLATSSKNPYTADYRGWSWVGRRYLGRRVNPVLPGRRSAAIGRFARFALLTVGLAGLLVGCGWAIVAGDAKLVLIGLAVVAA